MKKGIVFEIEGGNAIIMKNDGEFVKVAANSQWRKGDVVTIKAKTINLKPISTIAACFLMIISFSAIGLGIYFNESALISLDVNPSLELSVNRFDRVIDARALNDEGDNILEQINVKNKLLDDAVLTLIEQGLGKYVQNNPLVTFTVYSPDMETQKLIMSNLQDTADNYISAHHANVQVELLSVDKELINVAHEYNVTAGKYTALKELQSVLPGMEMENYSHHSISYIKEQTKYHKENHDASNTVEGGACTPKDNEHDSMQEHNDSDE